MAFEPFQVMRKHDWCHLCGSREALVFVDFHLPANAEHDVRYPDQERGPSRYVRACEGCVSKLAKAIRDWHFSQAAATR